MAKKRTKAEIQFESEQVSEITNFVQIEAHMECSNYNVCKEVIGGQYDEYSLAEDAFNEGWRFVSIDLEDDEDVPHILCPKCYKKHNAKSKKKSKRSN